MLAIFQVSNKFFEADGRVVDAAGRRGEILGAWDLKSLGSKLPCWFESGRRTTAKNRNRYRVLHRSFLAASPP